MSDSTKNNNSMYNFMQNRSLFKMSHKMKPQLIIHDSQVMLKKTQIKELIIQKQSAPIPTPLKKDQSTSLTNIQCFYKQLPSISSTPKSNNCSKQLFSATRAQLLTYITTIQRSLTQCLHALVELFAHIDSSTSHHIESLFSQLQQSLQQSIAQTLNQLKLKYIREVMQRQSNDYSEAHEYRTIIQARISELDSLQTNREWRDVFGEVLSPCYQGYIADAFARKDNIIERAKERLNLKLSEHAQDIHCIIVQRSKNASINMVQDLFRKEGHSMRYSRRMLSQSSSPHVGQKQC